MATAGQIRVAGLRSLLFSSDLDTTEKKLWGVANAQAVNFRTYFKCRTNPIFENLRFDGGQYVLLHRLCC
jgi:hypothetical protein